MMSQSVPADASATMSRSDRPEFDDAIDALRATWKLRDPHLIAASRDLAGGRVDDAKRVLRKALAKHPRNPDALTLMAEIARREGRDQDAEHFLARCVES